MQLSTKQKGDIGLTQIIAKLTKCGYSVALPVSEHLPFDLLVIGENYTVYRVSIKYREIAKGCVEFPMRTISSNAQGYKVKHLDYVSIDAFAIYCPQTNKCYFGTVKELEGRKSSMAFRIEGRGNQKTHYAKDYEDPQKVFGNSLE